MKQMFTAVQMIDLMSTPKEIDDSVFSAHREKLMLKVSLFCSSNGLKVLSDGAGRCGEPDDESEDYFE
jgi:hypothetical protein